MRLLNSTVWLVGVFISLGSCNSFAYQLPGAAPSINKCSNIFSLSQQQFFAKTTSVAATEGGEIPEKMMSSKDAAEIWKTRRKIIRSFLKPVASTVARQAAKLERDVKEGKLDEGDDVEGKQSKVAAVSATFLLVIGTIAFRVGGRGALAQLLGLDFIADSDLSAQITSFIQYFQGLQDAQQAALFFCAWFLAKLLCIDAFTIVLAVSSGVLFGGLGQGVLASVLCSSSASLLIFLVARSLLRERAAEQIAKRPALAAVDRSCKRDGLKTVFTLRVSPLLPIPIGGYNYLYAVTSVSALDFLTGITLGSIKPYTLDSYLGLFGKSILEESLSAKAAALGSIAGVVGAVGESPLSVSGPVPEPSSCALLNSSSDAVLFGVLALVVVVGTFATQLATSTWEEIQTEMRVLKSASDRANGEGGGGEESSMGLLELMGVQESELPGWALHWRQSLLAANHRILRLIDYEWAELSRVSTPPMPEPELARGERKARKEGEDEERERAAIDAGVLPTSGSFKQFTVESTIFLYVLMNKCFQLSKPPNSSSSSPPSL